MENEYINALTTMGSQQEEAHLDKHQSNRIFNGV